MELYPEGLLPAGRPQPLDFVEAAGLQNSPGIGALASEPVLPPVGSDAPLSGDDVDFLERVLRECHLHDSTSAQVQPAQSQEQQPPMAPATPAAPPVVGGQRPDAAGISGTRCTPAGSSAVEPWVDALLQRLQACRSPEEARQPCTELLVTFAGSVPGGAPAAHGLPAMSGAASVQMEARMRNLQGANSVLLRGFRSLYHKQREAEAQRQRAEEACARLAAEFTRCQEQLQASERAKGLLQYHLQLVSTGPGTAAGGM